MPRFTSLSEYKEYLRSEYVNPDEKHKITMEVSELEINALEDLIYTKLSPEEEKIIRAIASGFWMKLVGAIDK